MIRLTSLAVLLLHLAGQASFGAQFNYELCRVNDLIAEIESAIPEKSQFETEIAYRERLEKSVRTKIPASRLQNIVCANNGERIRYDPDAESIIFSLLSGFTTSSESMVVRKYVAQNAFGATREVEVIETKKAGISWVTSPDLSIDYRVSMSPSRAEQLLPNLRMAVVGDIVPRFLKLSTMTLAATFSSPTEVIMKSRELIFEPKRLILFDEKTREIILTESIVWCQGKYDLPFHCTKDPGEYECRFHTGDFYIGKCPSVEKKKPTKSGR